MLVYETRYGSESVFLLKPYAVVAVQGSEIEVEGEGSHCLLRFSSGDSVEIVGFAQTIAEEIRQEAGVAT